MAIRTILTVGNPLLKKPNGTITGFDTPGLKKLIRDLKETMVHEGLIGLAAPQIGENYRVFVTHPRSTKSRNLDIKDKFRVYINPIITVFSKQQSTLYEGCGCVPDLFGPVERPREIQIKANGEKGEAYDLKCDGILARVIQHEYDHLSGIEFIEKISDYSKMMTRKNYLKYVKNSDLQKQASVITKLEES